MDTKDLTVTTEFEASIQNVFRSITVDVSKWWGRNDFQGNSTHLDDEFTIHHPGAHFSRQKLIEVIPDKRVVWLVTESRLDWLTDKGEWTGTKMIFDLSANGDKTILKFTHQGLIPQKECYNKCAQGWNVVIGEWLHAFISKKNEAPFDLR